MPITHLSQLPEWARRNHSTASKQFFMDLLNVHERAENQGLETPSEVEALRLLKEIHANTSGAKVRRSGAWTLFKRVVGTVLKDGEELMKG